MEQAREPAPHAGYNAAMLSALPVALRLSLYWFCTLGALGVYFPYFSLYLKENVGLSGGNKIRSNDGEITIKLTPESDSGATQTFTFERTLG